MVENTSAPSKRGRPPKFDRDEVVGAAIGAFFSKGFDDTTLGDLEAATGVDRSTLYNSFGGKNGLYHEATKRYVDHAADHLFDVLHDDSDDGLGDVVRFLERIRSGLTSQAVSPGCLIVNDMAAGSDPTEARRYRELLDGGLRAALTRAEQSDSIASGTAANRAAVLSSAVIGVNLVSRHTGDNTQVDELLGATIAEVESWRVTDEPRERRDTAARQSE